jgi:hypothetical protein
MKRETKIGATEFKLSWEWTIIFTRRLEATKGCTTPKQYKERPASKRLILFIGWRVMIRKVKIESYILEFIK